MEVFRTTFEIPACERKICHKEKVLSIGSCFSDIIGDKLLQGKFKVLANPYGVVYNPVSLFSLLSNALSDKEFPETLVLAKDERYFHYQVHSEINASSREELLLLLRDTQRLVKRCLLEASHVFITLGTAFVFELLEPKALVANCHKQPASRFARRMLEPDEMMAAFETYFQLQMAHNPNVEIVLTVSPVRHIREGMLRNQVSKSQLRLLCHRLEKDFEKVSYFPSYELMMDDLRDYRFYKPDMIHPSGPAEDYVWEHFKACYFDSGTSKLLKRVENVKQALSHRPFNPRSNAHKEFLMRLLEKITEMPDYLDYSEEMEAIDKQIKQTA
ncbi:GSCFA domain-containing protein [Negadavirga shengliensis]|uniref:GSCFA domain-containing protein n=1 Tax=Negadavirga shengliensis TaxID=1389218 RepID=A0ABV9T5G4_9BACT